MDYIVSFRVKIDNPPWKKVFLDFLIRYIVPLVPLFRLMARDYRTIHKSVVAGMVYLIAILIGILVMASMFSIPVILFCVAMGWIK